MIKKIAIADIQLDNYTARESVMKIDRFLNDPVMNIVEEVNMDLLLKAQTDEPVKELVNQMDLTVIADAQILSLAGSTNERQEREIREHEFFFEILKRFERNRKRIFILGKTTEAVEQLISMLEVEFPRCEIAGTEATDNCIEQIDAIVNEINAATADVIISVIPVPEQELFLIEHKDKLSAKIWYGIGEEKIAKPRRKFFGWLKRHSGKKKIKEHIANYEETEQQE